MLSELDFLKHACSWCQTLPIEKCNGCDACGLRCTRGVPMTRFEYMAIKAFLQGVPGDKIARVLGENKNVHLGDGIYAEACLFRDMQRGLCFVYPVRPLICRLFGLVSWLPCPTDQVSLAGEEAVTLFQQYAAYERHTYEEWVNLNKE